MSDDVREERYQRMTRLLLDSRLNADALPDAVEKLHYDTVQLLLEGGGDPAAHRRNRGLFEICVINAPPLPGAHASFGELASGARRPRRSVAAALLEGENACQLQSSLGVDLQELAAVRGQHCAIQVALAHAVGLAVAARLRHGEGEFLEETAPSKQVWALLQALEVCTARHAFR